MAIDITLTDGGIETRIIYEFKMPDWRLRGLQAALFRNEAGRDILRRICRSNAEVAVRRGFPIHVGAAACVPGVNGQGYREL